MASKTQSGFSAVLSIMAVVLVIGVLGIIGWRLYSQPSKPTSNATTNSQPNKVNASSTTTTTHPTYLVVKEWGVELPLSDTIKDAYYVVPTGVSNDTDGLPSGIILGVKSLDARCGVVTSDPKGYKNLIGEIVRVPPTAREPLQSKPYTQLYPNGETIGGYYYGYMSAIQGKTCVSQTTLQSIDSAFATAVKGIASQPTYLDIKELGIKFLLNSQINDAIYSIVPTTDGSKGAGISAQSLVDLSATCSTSHYTLGLIEATTTAPTNVNGQVATPDNKSLFKINNTYYWYRPPQNEACVTPGDQKTSDAIGIKLSAFEQAFTTLQSDQ